jgi:hypothetical protein
VTPTLSVDAPHWILIELDVTSPGPPVNGSPGAVGACVSPPPPGSTTLVFCSVLF